MDLETGPCLLLICCCPAPDNILPCRSIIALVTHGPYQRRLSHFGLASPITMADAICCDMHPLSHKSRHFYANTWSECMAQHD